MILEILAYTRQFVTRRATHDLSPCATIGATRIVRRMMHSHIVILLHEKLRARRLYEHKNGHKHNLYPLA